MKLSKTFLFITALCCAAPTLAIQNSTSSSGEQKMAMENTQNIREIYLAGGCFWGMEAYMERIHGVKDAISSYANGNAEKTSYQMIGVTDHAETVKVTYDANQISLDKLLKKIEKINHCQQMIDFLSSIWNMVLIYFVLPQYLGICEYSLLFLLRTLLPFLLGVVGV